MVWSLTILGLGIVFAVLGILYLFFLLIGALFSRKKPVVVEPQPVSGAGAPSSTVPLVAPSPDVGEEGKTIAIISSVIAAVTQGRGRVLRVRSVSSRGVSKWKTHEPEVEWRIKRKRW